MRDAHKERWFHGTHVTYVFPKHRIRKKRIRGRFENWEYTMGISWDVITIITWYITGNFHGILLGITRYIWFITGKSHGILMGSTSWWNFHVDVMESTQPWNISIHQCWLSSFDSVRSPSQRNPPGTWMAEQRNTQDGRVYVAERQGFGEAFWDVGMRQASSTIPKRDINVGGLEHQFCFSIYWDESSSQLTHIFQRVFSTTNQE